MIILSMSSKRDNIAMSLTDKNNKEVVWYKESYDWHLYFKHMDMQKYKNFIIKAVKSPQLVDYNKKRKSTDYYYLERILLNGSRKYIKVVVDYTESPAFIRTAHQTSNIGSAVAC